MLIEANKITKSFKRKGKYGLEFEVIKEISFEADKGSFIAIVGRSGGGKSTFLSILSGLLKPDSGSVLFEGSDLYALDDDKLGQLRNESFGIVPQDHMVLKNFTVLENILIAREMYGRECDEEAVEELLSKVGLKDYSSFKASELSGGELRRLAIARALINSPKIIFADEPSGDLDEENTRKIMDIFKDLNLNGVAVILVTHDKDVMDHADRIYRMDNGVLSDI